MALPIVAIIGRPNVGKSSLLNSLAGDRISIVDPRAGVTRDRVSVIIEKGDLYFELVDTGGYGIVDSDHLEEHVEGQIRQAMGSADLVLFVVDLRDGLMALDVKIAELLRKEDLDVILVANKADNVRMFPQAGEFTRLGFGDAICISTMNNLNKLQLMEKILAKVEHMPAEKPEKAELKFCILGKRNAGKSSFVNAIVGQERVIVSEVPGTTRDSVDVRFEKEGKTYVVVDTAGLRKKARIVNDDLEFYSFMRVQRSLRMSDVAVFMIDAAVPLSQVDKKLGQLITDEFKACVIVINKWDLARDKAEPEDYAEYIGKMLPGLQWAPIVLASAKEKLNIDKVIELVRQVYKQATMKLPTPKLNKAIETIMAERGPGAGKGRGAPKIYYATQVATEPVTIMMFVNRPALFDDNYQRFMIRKLREHLMVKEVPIRLMVKGHRAPAVEGQPQERHRRVYNKTDETNKKARELRKTHSKKREGRTVKKR
jgi:GTP-binding protein